VAREDVEAVRAVFAFWEHGDWGASADLFDPDFEAVFSATAFPDPGVYRGADATLAAWRSWLEAWDRFRLDLEELIDLGGRVVALNSLRGRGKASGIAIESAVGCIFDCVDGRIRRMEFCDRRRALEAVEASG
jgi:ketosteroid isomerase-like protein